MQSSSKEGPNKRQRSMSRSPSPRGSPASSWGNSARKRRSAAGDDLTQRTQRNIPAFLNKLYSMVDDASTNDLIRWSDEGNSFIVEQHELFSKTVLPRFYKHNTFSSFVRQLNMYDFHKVPHLQQGVLVTDSEHELWEFSHPNFQKDRYDLLHLVVRKRIRSNNDQQPQQSQQQQTLQLSNTTSIQSSYEQHQPLLLEQSVSSRFENSTLGHNRLNALGDTPMDLEHVRLGSLVKDISTIRHHQHAISADLQHLHNDNEILWRETLLAREKHQRHQQVIERILLFLTSVFSTDGFSAETPNGIPYALGKHSEYLASPQTGTLDSAAAPPSRLIEEAVKLAGISTTSLQQSYFGGGGESSRQDEYRSPSFGQQATLSPRHQAPNVQQQQQSQQPYQQSLHRNLPQQATRQPHSQDQGQSQDKGKFGMYGTRELDPSFLFRALNDLYSIRHTSPSTSSHPHGMNSSAMKSTTSIRNDQSPLVMHTSPSGLPDYGHHQQRQGTMGTISSVDSDATPMTGRSDKDNIPGHQQYNPLSTLSDVSGGADGGDITRISGLAESLHTATRSAEAISQDIDDLQISIESLAATMGLDANEIEDFDGYLDEFTDNYSNMISLATRNDKMQLFELAGNDSNTYGATNQSHHQHLNHQHLNHQQQEQQDGRNVSNLLDPTFSTLPPSSNDGM